MESDLGLPELREGAAGEARAMALLREYASALPLSDGVDPRDRAPGDSLVALAADALLAPHVANLTHVGGSLGPSDAAARLRAMLQV